MLLDAMTTLVRRFGPFRTALVVSVICMMLSALLTVITMRALGSSIYPAIYLATITPLILALPVTYLTNLAVERADRAQQSGQQSEREARAAEAMLSDAIENFPGGFALFDAEDRLILCNEQHRKMYPEIEDLIVPGVAIADLVHADAEHNFVRNFGSPDEYVGQRFERHQKPTEPFEQQLSDGSWVLVNEQRTQDGYTVIVRTDTTPLKQASNALRESEERFFKVFQASPVVIGITDASTQ